MIFSYFSAIMYICGEENCIYTKNHWGDMATNNNSNPNKRKFVQVYMTDAEFELLQEMANDAAISKSEFVRNLILRDGSQFRDRKNASESLQLAA